jgi:eukaryotic-like serine/threonine-protein kinase
VKDANGLGPEETLLSETSFPVAWSPDGRFIILLRDGVKTRFDMWVLPQFGDRKEYQLLDSVFDEVTPQFSPDGRWLAYSSDDTGTFEIYVQSFSADGKLGSDKKRISTNGGRFPAWRHDGSELFYIAADGSVMAATVKAGGNEFEFSTPKALFRARLLTWAANFHELDVTPDGQRFLIGTRIGEPTAPPPTVILNWTAAMKK